MGTERNPVQTVYDIDGNVLKAYRAPTRKQAVERMVKNGVFLDRADLRGADLNGIKLGNGSPARLRNANLANARLKGTQLRGADLTGADLTGAALQGADIGNATGRQANLTDARLEGACLTFGDWAGALMRNTRLTGASASCVDLSGAAIANCTFDEASLKRLDVREAGLFHNSFRHARLIDDRSDGTPVNYTRNAAVIGNFFMDADLGTDHPAMRWDRLLASAWRKGVYCTMFTAFWSVGWAIEWGIDQLPSNTTVAVLAPTALIAGKVVSELGLDAIMERAYERVRLAELEVRNAFADLREHLGEKAHIAAAVVRDRMSADKIEAALATNGQETHGNRGRTAYKALAPGNGLGHVIIAERGRLEKALHTIDLNADGHRYTDSDTVVVRLDEDGRPRENLPAAIRFHAEGGMTAAWLKENRVALVTRYDSTGCVRFTAGPDGLQDDGPVHAGEDTLKEFRDALLDAGGLSDLKYPPETHRLIVGPDGTAAVRHKTTDLLDNPDGPALVDTCGTRYCYTNGREEVPEPDAGLQPT